MSNTASDLRAEDDAARIRSAFSARSTARDVVADCDLRGRNAIVTGGASGIGIETVRSLAEAGAEVVIAARRLDAGHRVADAINATLDEPRIRVEALDLANLGSVRAFATRWGVRPLHLLVNNAGIMACPLSRTDDGFEMQLGVNHLGHFALTRCLMPALLAAAPARVVVVSSAGHHDADVDLDDPDYKRRAYDPYQAYGQSKTANVLFAVGLTQRYGSAGVSANALHPGAILTPLGKHVGVLEALRKGWLPYLGGPKMRSPAKGAATSVWVATAPELDGIGGRYFEDCSEARPWSADVKFSGVKSYALDSTHADEVWKLSERLLEPRW